MPWCPKCKKPAEITVKMTIEGYLSDEDDIDCYPHVQGEVAEPDDIAECMECEYSGELSKFKNK
jgi:hypothetical protein